MLNLLVAFAVATLPFPVSASGEVVFMATSAEKASGFESLAECERSLGKPADAVQAGGRGSVFNRNAGNTSRCEMVDGEPLVVVYPKGHEAIRTAR